MAPDNGGFLLEYPLIRVDNFTGSLPHLPDHLDEAARHDLPVGATHYVHPHIFLLSHPHTDHLNGLSSIARHSAPIYCSQVTKDLLLALERKEDRIRYDQGKTPSRKKPYSHLRRTVQECRALDRQTGMRTGAAYDILVALPFDKPIVIRYSATVQIRLTLLPANHMPGSTMFFIEGPRGAVLHTGDLRCEAKFIHSLLAATHLGRIANARSPTLMISPSSPANARFGSVQIATHSSPSTPTATVSSKVHTFTSTRLVALYLDTERMSDSDEPSARADAILDTIQAMKLFPSHTRFHVDCWTSGYEHFLLSAYKAFGDGKIHVDRYKADLYTLMAQDEDFSDLAEVCSMAIDECGRICACDRAECLSACVSIVPRETMSKEEWQAEKRELVSTIRAARQGRTTYPTAINLPLQRHSPLPELYRMVETLRPEHIVANTASPSARFLCARMTEMLSLAGAPDSDRRHRLPPIRRERRDEDGDVWQNMEKVWNKTLCMDDSNKMTAAESFLAQVARFRKTLWGQRKLESERLLTERLDAACDGSDEKRILPDASASVLQIRNQNNFNDNAKPWQAPGKYAATNTSPFMTAAMRKAGVVTALPAWPAPSGSSPDRPIARIEDRSVTPHLSTELASRYLAYAAMYLGWKIRNPSRYRQDVAWRAIRKLKPALAHETEDALQRELGWAIPPWDHHPATAVQDQIPTSPCERAAIDAIDVTMTRTKVMTPVLPAQHQSGEQADVQQSISPLQIGRAELERQLANEAESQRLGYTDEDDDDHDIVSDKSFNDPDSQAPTVSDEDLAETVYCLRRGCDVPRSVHGLSSFTHIVHEWQCLSRASTPYSLTSPARRLRDQLNIVGVAAYSRRARALLKWGRADFKRASRALHLLSNRFSNSAAHSLPARHRVVLRYLRGVRPTTPVRLDVLPKSAV